MQITQEKGNTTELSQLTKIKTKCLYKFVSALLMSNVIVYTVYIIIIISHDSCAAYFYENLHFQDSLTNKKNIYLKWKPFVTLYMSLLSSTCLSVLGATVS